MTQRLAAEFIGTNCTIHPSADIGEGVVIGNNVVIDDGVYIGPKTRIQSMAYICRGTLIGEKVFIGPMVCTANDHRIVSHGRGRFVPNAPVICSGARIGAGALLMPGVTVGKNAFVAAGARVCSGALVPDGEMWAGNPAHRIGLVPEEEYV